MLTTVKFHSINNFVKIPRVQRNYTHTYRFPFLLSKYAIETTLVNEILGDQ